ncbi:hypothetical protein [Acidithiobacillus caldus]|uniref:Uncharacterized protein n=1 Tax=Acidithiobacillus caldus TaxID=33059 RepID=A0A1E7YSN7_9PROT|nr:hypothetical protein [Acidithiobacillus caldus]OFC36602.1 hypothetical protein BAE27_05915 [Acidithiobacillus caldus]OFC38216.1 hypothetical protein BAE29_09170 [Acidithiobacillus caldus]OFC39326.1 hypothetical protein BAE28_03915 [Acidithiobacillus caldus]OFC45736.1 hypothetical protein BAE30_13800 [Acidithiobacillus caldus]
MQSQKHPGAELSIVPLFDLPDMHPEHQQQVEKKRSILQSDFKLDDSPLCLPVHAEDAEDLFEICEENTETPAFTLDENLELHVALLRRTCEEFHEALTTRDYPLMQDIWSWFLDTSWRPFSFRVCAAIANVDTDVFRFQLSLHLKKHWPHLLVQKPDCSPTTKCLPEHQ